jgi:hypothetical protein
MVPSMMRAKGLLRRGVRVGLLGVALAVTVLAGGCGSSPAPANVGPAAAGPTGPVDYLGHPLHDVCGLLSPHDILYYAGITVAAPASPATLPNAPSMASPASCDYGQDATVTVQLTDNTNAATTAMQTIATAAKVSPTAESGLIGGVDGSVYGQVGKGAVIALHRNRLVVAISLASMGSGLNPRTAMLNLAAQVLTRVNNLGS